MRSLSAGTRNTRRNSSAAARSAPGAEWIALREDANIASIAPFAPAGEPGRRPAIFNVAGFWDHDGWLALLFFFLLGFGGAKTAREPISERA
jgi:hypothetical protein